MPRISVVEDTIGRAQLQAAIEARGVVGAADMIMRTLYHETFERRINRKTGKDKDGNPAKLSIDPAKIDLRAVAECFMGEARYNALKEDSPRAFGPVMETTDALAIADPFGPVGGQIVFAEIGQAMMEEDDITPDLVTERPSDVMVERIPWLTDYPDDGEAYARREDGEDFKSIGFSNEFIDTPETQEFGRRLQVSARDLMFTRIGNQAGVLSRAQAVGKVIARIKIDKVLLGGPLGQVPYIWASRSPVGLAPYAQATGAIVDWINELPANVLQSKIQLQNLNHLFDGMVDPVSGRALEITPDMLLVTGSLWENANDIVSNTFTEDRVTSGTTQTIRRVNGNGLRGPVQVRMMRRIAQLALGILSNNPAEIAELFWYGQPKMAWGWLNNYGLEVAQHGGQNTVDWVRRRIVLEVRASLMGTFYWRQHGPRFITRSFGVLTPPP